MKKKIVNGILLVAMLFATTSAFVSCKDTDSDVKAELDSKYAALEKKFIELQTTVGQIKSCNCEGKYYTKAEIDEKLSTLSAAINDVKNLIPDVSGFLKTSELNGKVQALLADYYTKTQVDATITGLLQDYAKMSDVIAMNLTEDQVNALINAALKDYAKISDIPEIPASLTEDQVNALIIAALADYAKKSDIPDAGLAQDEVNALIAKALTDYAKKSDIPEIPASLTQEQVNALIIAALKDYAKKSDIPATLTQAQVQKLIDDALSAFNKELPETFTKDEIIKIIGETIEVVNLEISSIYLNEVTSISVDKVVNPIFEFSTPFGVNSNVLITFFGEKATRHIFFPKGAEEPIIWKGDYLIGGTGNAGKLYVTVNPSSVDFAGKMLKLVSTTGNEAPVELTPLVESNTELKYLSRGDNAFYETYATIPEAKIANAYFSCEPKDMKAFRGQIEDLLKNGRKENIADMLQALTNLLAGNDVPAYRLQAEWIADKSYYTYSPANIAAVAIKPLTYAFDISDAAELDVSPINELERLETYVVNKVAENESQRSKIWRWLNKFNKETNKWLEHINWALQPTMFIEANDEISRPGVEENYKEYKAGEIKLIPSSWTVELFAPAFKKYVVVTSVNGEPVKADKGVNASNDLLGKVIPGSVNVIPFTIEAGKTYDIQYSALDYEGNIRTTNYYIKGIK